MAENDLCEMSPVDSADTLEGKKFRRNRSISHHFQDKCVYVFYAEIQDGCQKWRENDFWKKSPVNSGDTLGIKKFDKIVSEINAFYTEIQDGHQNGGKMIFGKNHQFTLLIFEYYLKVLNQFESCVNIYSQSIVEVFWGW